CRCGVPWDCSASGSGALGTGRGNCLSHRFPGVGGVELYDRSYTPDRWWPNAAGDRIDRGASDLRGRMPTHNSKSKSLQLEPVNLHYLDYAGPGPHTLVCVHGGGANAHWFDLVGPALAHSCRVLAVDLRGHGESSWAEPPVYTFEA